jgi:hypothetical protein
MSDTDSDSDIVKDFLVKSYENLDRLLASKTGPWPRPAVRWLQNVARRAAQPGRECRPRFFP